MDNLIMLFMTYSYANATLQKNTRLEFYILICTLFTDNPVRRVHIIFETSVFSHIRVAGLLRLLDFFKCLCDILNKILCIFQSTAHADQVWCNATGNQFFLG